MSFSEKAHAVSNRCDLRFAIRITNRNRSQIAWFGALSSGASHPAGVHGVRRVFLSRGHMLVTWGIQRGVPEGTAPEFSSGLATGFQVSLFSFYALLAQVSVHPVARKRKKRKKNANMKNEGAPSIPLILYVEAPSPLFSRKRSPPTKKKIEWGPQPGIPKAFWADPGVLWKKAPRAMRAMRGKTLETVPFQPYFGCTRSFLKVLSN